MSGKRLYLLDASAMLALVLNERGAERVEAVMDHAAIHAVNFTEVVTKLVQGGVPVQRARSLTDELAIGVYEEFSVDQAEAAGRLHAATRDCGLSLGDVICLTMARCLGLTAVTSERIWAGVGVREGTKVLCIR